MCGHIHFNGDDNGGEGEVSSASLGQLLYV